MHWLLILAYLKKSWDASQSRYYKIKNKGGHSRWNVTINNIFNDKIDNFNNFEGLLNVIISFILHGHNYMKSL